MQLYTFQHGKMLVPTSGFGDGLIRILRHTWVWQSGTCKYLQTAMDSLWAGLFGGLFVGFESLLFGFFGRGGVARGKEWVACFLHIFK